MLTLMFVILIRMMRKVLFHFHVVVVSLVFPVRTELQLNGVPSPAFSDKWRLLNSLWVTWCRRFVHRSFVTGTLWIYWQEDWWEDNICFFLSFLRVKFFRALVSKSKIDFYIFYSSFAIHFLNKIPHQSASYTPWLGETWAAGTGPILNHLWIL
jgi:hypothetical protein